MAEGQKSGMDEEIAMALLLGVVVAILAYGWLGNRIVGSAKGFQGGEHYMRYATRYLTWGKYKVVNVFKDDNKLSEMQVREAILDMHLWGVYDKNNQPRAAARYITNAYAKGSDGFKTSLVCNDVIMPGSLYNRLPANQRPARGPGINVSMAGQFDGQYRWGLPREFLINTCKIDLLALNENQIKAAEKGEYVAPVRAITNANGEIVRTLPLRNIFTLSVMNEKWPIRIMSWFFGLLIAGPLAWMLYSRNAEAKYNKKLTLGMFIGEQARVWKSIVPAAVSDPLSDTSGKWAEAMTPEEWMKKEGILMIDNTPDREGVRAAFIKQLRKPWYGARRLPPHARALCAAMAYKGNGKPNMASDLLARLNDAWGASGRKVETRSIAKAIKSNAALRKEIDDVLADPALGGKLFEAARLHAFEETAMATMLTWARKRGGVMASAEFLWLKCEDRELWYVLNNVGRPTYHVEASGALAHWKVELAMGRPLPEPDVDEAIFGLEEYLGLNEQSQAA